MFDSLPKERAIALPMPSLIELPMPGWQFAPALVVPFVAAARRHRSKRLGCSSVAKGKRYPVEATEHGFRQQRPRYNRGRQRVLRVLGRGRRGHRGRHVGLAAATGAMSRSIGIATALLFTLLAFMPRFTETLAALPAPVMGAGLLFVTCHLLASGAELSASRMLDARRNYVVGLPLLAGIGMMVVPDISCAHLTGCSRYSPVRSPSRP